MNLREKVRAGYEPLLRRWCEARGSDRFSRPALHDLDRKLERHLDLDNGFFVEAGANDGLKQSNTYYFERLRGWRGILVEAHPVLAARCRRRRTNALVVQAALVEPGFPGATIPLIEAGLMSAVPGAFVDATAMAQHLDAARGFEQPVSGQVVIVPARTLTAVLDEARAPAEFDLLSLDVEGYEPAVLRGLDFERYRPRFICVEVRDRPQIDALLSAAYSVVDVLYDGPVCCDILFRRR
jgi:FkbM family methyltransferase